MTFLLRLLARLISLTSTSLKLGAGIAWSGEIALFLDRQIFTKLIPPESKVILIAGTNGKTTTAKMIQEMLHQDFTVIHNATGANLLNGLVGTILVTGPIFSKKKPAFVFEIDESNLPGVISHITPDVLVLLNLFRDQLDRYGEVDTISKKWLANLSSVNLKQTSLILNGDDPSISFLGWKLKQKVKKIQYFGINDKSLFLSETEHAVDAMFCPNCGNQLKFEGVYLSHLGNYNCSKCNFAHPKLNIEASKVETSLTGLYMVYNAMAAFLAGQELDISSERISNALKNFQPAFGRQEEIKSGGKTIKILLSKNPAGFNASLKTALENDQNGQFLLVLNDRIPDGHDVSWIWDVDFEVLAKTSCAVRCSGDRVYDLALRLKYGGIKTQMDENLEDAIKNSLIETKPDQTLWLLATYSAMLEARKILTGKKIL